LLPIKRFGDLVLTDALKRHGKDAADYFGSFGNECETIPDPMQPCRTFTGQKTLTNLRPFVGPCLFEAPGLSRTLFVRSHEGDNGH
jgi:hypothetical protein